MIQMLRLSVLHSLCVFACALVLLLTFSSTFKIYSMLACIITAKKEKKVEQATSMKKGLIMAKTAMVFRHFGRRAFADAKVQGLENSSGDSPNQEETANDLML
jgi:hypothetical protein